MQLTLFPQQSENTNKDEIEDLKERYERLRKSQHARITGLQKRITELESKLSLIEANICKGLLL